MKLRFAEPRSENYENPAPVRNDHSKEEIIELAMQAFEWKEAKCLSWYKLQTAHLGGNSPMELVQRKQTAKIIAYLQQKAAERKSRDLLK
jgi:hypothetical protein